MMAGELRVECYAGYRGEEVPRRFYLDKHLVEVAAVIDRWLTPDYRYFKLQDEEGKLYILRHDTEGQRWELTSSTGEGRT